MRGAFHAGLAYWEQRDAVAAASAQLRRLAAAIGDAPNLSAHQWGQLFAATIDFAPTLIVELGRHRGNSTCVFTTAARAVGGRVVSLCLSPLWRTETVPAIDRLVPPSWLSHVDAREEDIAAADFAAIVGDAARVLVFWDAHGYHLADHVLGRLLPLVADRPHLVVMHDVSDARYDVPAAAAGYRGHGLWRGNDWSGPFVRLGHLQSNVEQAVAAVDFTSRNGIALRTAAEQIHEIIGAHAFRVETMERALGDLWAPQAHWCHFTLNERPGPYRFPTAARVAVPARPFPTPSTPRTSVRETPVRLERARHAQSLEIVVTGRADDHGGPEFFERLAAAATHNHALLERAGIPHAFTLVEWNPIPGRRTLAEAVIERLPFWDRAYVVDPAWHAAISTNPRLQFMEFFAKNVAVRRSTADAVLTTNSDVFLSEELVARIAAAPVADEHVYRAIRHDVNRHCDWRTGGEAVLADPRHHLRVNRLTAPEYSNAAGDFLLLTTATFRRLRGFNETVRFAKIHKDGQFCHRAWIEGLPFETLGPIWHLDHDGSYSNVGVLQGAPDAPYGPEWAWREDYRNPAGWGLRAAIEEPAGTGRIVWLRHPSTHGPALSIVPAGAPDAAEALAAATGRFVLIDAPEDLEPWERVALERLLADAGPRAAVFAGASHAVATGAAWPAQGAPFVVARDVVDAVAWPAHDRDPAQAFWREAIRTTGTSPARLPWPGSRVFADAVKAPPADVRAAGDALAREVATALASGAAVVGAWLASLDLPASSSVAVGGPDWATPWLLAAIRGAGHRVTGLYTADARVAGSIRCGHVVHPVEEIVAAPPWALVTGWLDPAIEARLRRAGFTGAVHGVAAMPAGVALPDLPSELSMLLDAQRAVHEDADGRERTLRFAALATLAGPARHEHAYDAALGWERRGRPDEAARTFANVMADEEAPAALRGRARFHVGRLCYERGDYASAREHLSDVLRETPDHRRARGYLEAMDRVAGGGA